MACEKCGYLDKKESILFGKRLCDFCKKFAPTKKEEFEEYLSEKVDWRILETFRKYDSQNANRKKGMRNRINKGLISYRAPLGYSINEGNLIQNEEASRVHSLFKTFLNRKYSLNSLARNFRLSTNGVKKILSNRAYLGELKFDGKIYKSTHQGIISPEIFYAVQRKLKTYLRPRKKRKTI